MQIGRAKRAFWYVLGAARTHSPLLTPLQAHFELVRRLVRGIAEVAIYRLFSRVGGGAEGNRTPDLVIANDALSQLSYGPNMACYLAFPGRGVKRECGGFVFRAAAGHGRAGRAFERAWHGVSKRRSRPVAAARLRR